MYFIYNLVLAYIDIESLVKAIKLPLNKYNDRHKTFKQKFYNKYLPKCSRRKKKKKKTRNCQPSKKKKPYVMGTNFSGWGYPPSQTLVLSSCLPGIAVDVSSTSGSTVVNRVFAGIGGDIRIFSLVLPFEDDDDSGTEPSIIGLG